MIMKKQIILTILSCFSSLSMAVAMQSTSVYVNPNKSYSGLNKYQYSNTKPNNIDAYNYNYSPVRVSEGKVNSYGGGNIYMVSGKEGYHSTFNSSHNDNHAYPAISYSLPAKSMYSSTIHPIGANNMDDSDAEANMRRVNPFTPPADPFLPIGDMPWWLATFFAIITSLIINKKKKTAKRII